MEQTCALFICDGQAAVPAPPENAPPRALEEILFRPLLDWGLAVLREAGVPELAVLCLRSSAPIQNHVKEQYGDSVPCFSWEDGAALRAFVSGRDVCLLPEDSLFLQSEGIREAWLSHNGSTGQVTQIINEAGQVCAAWYREEAFADWLAEFCGNVYNGRAILESPLQGGIHNAEGDCRRGLRDAYELYQMTEYARQAILERHMRRGVRIPCTDGVLVAPDCVIGPGTRILPGTLLKQGVDIGADCEIGPNTLVSDSRIGDRVLLQSTVCDGAVIDEGATVGPFARIRPGTHLSNGVHAGNFVEIKNSEVGAGTKISHLTYIGDSDVGGGVNVGCGCATANYDGRRKYRTKIGEKAFVGCNTILVAPVKLGDGAYTAAGSVITEAVPDGALAVGRARQVNKEGWELKK